MTKIGFGLSVTLMLVIGFAAGKHDRASDPCGLLTDASQANRVRNSDRGSSPIEKSPQALAFLLHRKVQTRQRSAEELPCAADPSRKETGNFSAVTIEAEEMRTQRRVESFARAAAEYSSNEIKAAGIDVGATQPAIEPSKREVGGWPAGSVEAEELGEQQRSELAAVEAAAEYGSDLKAVGILAGAKAP